MLVTVSHPPPPDSVSATEPSGTHHTRSSLPNFVYRGADSLLRRESPAIHDTFHSRSPPPPAVSSYSPELSWPLSASPEPTPQQPQQQQPKLFDMTTLRPPSSSARRRPVIRGRARRLLDELDSKRAASSAAAAAAATHSRDDTQSPERSQEPESEPEPTQMPVRFSRDTNDDDDNDNGDDEDDEQDGGAPFFIVSRKSSQEPGESFTAHSRSRSNSNSSRARHSSFIPPWLTAPRSRSRSRSASASGSSTSLPALPVRASDSREIVPDVEADDEDEQDVAMMTIIDDSDEYDKTQRREGDKDKVEKSPSQLRNAAIDALFATDPAVWSDDGFSEEASPAPQPLLLPQTQAQAQRLCFTKASRHRAASEEGGAYASTSGFFEQTQSPALSVSSIGAISLVDETLPNGHSGDDADAEVNVEAEAEEPGRSTAFGLLFFSSDDDADADAIGESSAENDGELITYERQPASNASSPRLLGRLGLSSRSPLPLPSSLSPRPPLAFAATHSDSDSEHSSEAEDSNDDEDDDDAMSVQDGDDKASVAASSVVEEAIPLDAEEHESKADTDDEMGEDDEDESKSTVDASEDEPVIPITQKHRIARRHPAVSDSSSDSEAEDEEEGPSKHEQDDVDDAIDSESLASDHSAASSYVYPHPPECREVSVHWQPSVSILPQDDLASDAESEDSKSPDEKEDGSEQEQDINEAEGGGASSGEEIVPVATTVAVTAQEPLAELSDEIVAAAESLAAETAALEAQGGKYHRDFEDSLDADQSDEDSLLPAFSLDDHGAMSSDGATDRGEGDKSKSNDEASIGNSPPSLLLTKSPQSDDALTSSSQLVPPLMDKGMLLECLDKASLLVKTHKDAIVAKSPPAEAAGEQRYEGAQLLGASFSFPAGTDWSLTRTTNRATELYKLGAALDAQCESLKRVFVADRVAHNFELVLAHKTLLTANDTLLKHATAATASAVVVAEVQEPAAAEAPSSAVPVTSPPPPPASTTQLALSKSSVLAEVEQTIGVIEAHKAAFKAQLDACCLPGATADVAEIYPKYNGASAVCSALGAHSSRTMLLSSAQS